VNKENPGILCVQETKLVNISDVKSFAMWAVTLLGGHIEALIKRGWNFDIVGESKILLL